MFKKFVGALLISVLTLTATYSQNQPEEITVECKVEPRGRFCTNWVFVADTSSSLWSIFGRIRSAFLTTTQHPTDEMFFAAITFNDRGMHKLRDWVASSPREFEATDAWISTNRGVLSYGIPALELAIKQRRSPLTVIVITDGGFTEACNGRGFGAVRDAIAAAQRWRQEQNLAPAQICCLGIENPNYTAGGKPSDADCQAFLREMGETHGGGYYLVRGAAAQARGPSRPAPSNRR